MSEDYTVIKAGIGMGTALSMVLSWSANHSIIWAILHGVCTWIYVIYFALTKTY